MSNNMEGKIELNTSPQFREEIEKIRVANPQLGFENIESFILEATRLYAEKFGDTSKIAIPMQQVTVSEAVVKTLEVVWQQVNTKEDPSELKTAIAGDLLKAEVAMEIAKNGKIEPENVKKLALELFG